MDEVDQSIIRELQRDGRAPFSHIAQAVGVSEHTVARRYRSLLTLGLRVVAQPVPQRLGLTRWLLRLHTTPDASVKIADALARRPDTSWVSIASGGTELYCAVNTRSAHERDALLLHKLPHTPRVVSVSAHCLLHTFRGTTDAWYATSPMTGEDADEGRSQQTALASSPPPGAPLTLDATDEQLLAHLAKDGRATLPELAQATGRSPASVTRRLDRLRSADALRFFVDFAPEHLGFHMLVRLWVRVAPGALGTTGAALAAHPEIPFAAATTGPSNLVASGIFRGTYELYQYLDRRIGTLPGVRSVETAPILREVKRFTYSTTP
ncbi:Lrp/AsnC family transcriptional regulator [Streptomyces sp. HMX112]|uniref:Lrp/AsnC family transcriptional regulator n=1 Tax=Streptomyces sp. HMX112 TaxID=3390850 RepID=UPI003A81223B